MIPQKCFNTPIKGEVYRYSEDLQLSKQGRWNQFAIFCGTFPKVTFGGRYPPPFFRGARTFLYVKHSSQSC
jgi:hypothetical protein